MQQRKPTLALLATMACLGIALGACAPEGRGSVRLNIHTAALSTDDIARIELTFSGPGIDPPLVQDLSGDPDSGWSATLTGLEPGSDRTFLARAYDDADVLIYEGSASAVSIVAGQTTVVTIFMQQVEPPEPFDNTAPRITGISVSTYTVAPGGVVSLAVTAEDPDPSDSLTYAWTAHSGSFSETDIPDPDWTAPDLNGTILLNIAVADPTGATARLGINITVSDGLGTASVGVDVNTAPEVNTLVPNPTRIDTGDSTYLDLDVVDPDGDTLHFAWSVSGCSGSFDDPTSEDPSFTLDEDVPGWLDCQLSVQISDARGGVNWATIRVATGPGPCPTGTCGEPGAVPGELLWSTYSTFVGTDGPPEVTLTSNDEVVVAADIEGNDSERALAMRVYDLDGNYLRWDWISNELLDYSVYAAASDRAGNVYLAGSSFDGDESQALIQQSMGAISWGWEASFPGLGIYDMAFDANDDLWAVGISGSGEPYNLWVGRFDTAVGAPAEWSDSVALGSIWNGAGLAVASNGDVIVCVSFAGDGDDDVMLRRYRSDGVLLYSTVWDTSWDYRCEDVAIGVLGNIYAVGSYYTGADPDFWIAKFDPTGALIDSVTLHAGGVEITRSIAISASGMIYLAGDSSGMGNYLFSYFPSLIRRWDINPGGSMASGVIIDGEGKLLYTGLGNNLDTDFFVARIEP